MTNKFYSLVDGNHLGIASDFTPRFLRLDSLSIVSRLSLLPILLLCLTLFIGAGNAWGTTFTTTSSGGFSGSTTKSKTTDGITVTFSNGPSWQTGHVRVYQNNTISFSSSSAITTVVMNCTQGARDFDATQGSCSTANGKVTWEGSSTSFTLTLSSGAQVRISSIEVTVGSSCTKKITISKGTPSHGDFELSKSGAQATCDAAVTVVVTPDADDHYHVTGVTAPNSYSISDPDEDGKYTITYAQNTNASSEINVTFAENTKHTIHFLNNGITAHADVEVYDGENIGDLLPALTTSDACDETIKTFAGWTTEDIGSTPVHSIDASKIVDYWTKPEGEMTLNAIWATTSNTAKAQFIAANESAKTASEQNPVSLTSNNITFSYTSGNIYKSGTHNFGINANNYCTIEADGLVIEKAVVACTGSNYVIDGVSDGTLANNGLSVTDVRTNILALFASSSYALRITTLSVYTYDNYITKCCTPLGQIKGSFFLTHLEAKIMFKCSRVSFHDFTVSIPMHFRFIPDR